MKAEVVACAEGRVIVSRIRPMLGTEKTVCLELHRGEQGKATITVTHMILTPAEATEVSRALAEIARSG
jgi:hypothetical protein